MYEGAVVAVIVW